MSATTDRGLVFVAPEECIVYSILVRNSGGSVATNVLISDTIDTNVLRYVANSANPPLDGLSTVPLPLIDITQDQYDRLGSDAKVIENLAIQTLVWRLQSLAPNESRILTCKVCVQKNLGNVTTISNSAVATSSQTQNTPATSNVVFHSLEPAAVILTNFIAKPLSNGNVQVQWTTASEVNTYGFNIWRSDTMPSGGNINIPPSAKRLNNTLILARGSSQTGADYNFVDTTAVSGKTYYYWLEEIENDGSLNQHGPTASFRANNRTYIPVGFYSKR